MHQAKLPSRNIVLLGSTGSIGTSALRIIRQYPDRYRIIALSAGTNIDLLRAQIKEFSPVAASVQNKGDYQTLKKEGVNCRLYYGREGLFELLSDRNIDTVVSAITGTIALKATLEAIERGYRICLANKETMVAAGDLINKMLAKFPAAEIIPVDSEHSAIFQAIAGKPVDSIDKLILTASGGPFFKLNKEEFKNITLQQALRHPTWEMGKKITIDSATMMNKALEMIEAQYLFGIDGDRIEVLVHPQSIIHSLVEFIDSSVIAQMGVADMQLPILYSLTYPDRINTNLKRLNLAGISRLEFYNPDPEKFRSLQTARYVLKNKKSSGAIFNAANEVAVQAFINQQIGFEDIFEVVEKITYTAKLFQLSTVEAIDAIIEETKVRTKSMIKKEY
jgi:1-deoxy-D-xylulose-5-phosphate reductoisomerase